MYWSGIELVPSLNVAYYWSSKPQDPLICKTPVFLKPRNGYVRAKEKYVVRNLAASLYTLLFASLIQNIGFCAMGLRACVCISKVKLI